MVRSAATEGEHWVVHHGNRLRPKDYAGRHLLSLTRHPRDIENEQYLITGTLLNPQQAATEVGSGDTFPLRSNTSRRGAVRSRWCRSRRRPSSPPPASK